MGRCIHHRVAVRGFLNAAFAAVFLLQWVAPASAQAGETTKGYQYTLHEAGPPPPDFDKDPATFRRVVDRYVLQGPQHTMMWTNERDLGNPESATFGRGERRMGLFVPFWDKSRSASEETGWSSYGHTVHYKSFRVAVERGDRDREIAGYPAKHYVLNADVTERSERDSADMHISLSSNVWVVEDKPFSWAPYATEGVYADPRLQVAVYEELADLGMVVRSETVYSRQAQTADGTKLGTEHKGTHLAWLSDIKRADVPVMHMPTATGQTIRQLRTATRKHSKQVCRAALNGATPDFVSRLLNEGQQAAFMENLAAQCRARMRSGR